jgi:hypothetical protein
MEDIRTKADIESALDCQTINTTDAVTGPTIDMAGYEALDLCFNLEITTGALAVAVYEGDESNMSDEALVDSTQLIRSQKSSTTGTDTIHIGYVGNKRYVRVKVTGSDTPNMVAAGIAYKGKAHHAPTYSA